MKRNIFQYSLKTLFCLIILITTLTLPAQEWQWAYHAGNDIGEDKIMEIVTDDQGNCYVLYHYAAESNPMLDNQPIEFPEHYGNDKAFLLLASYDCHGEMRWYKTIYNTYYQYAESELYWHGDISQVCFLKIHDNQLLLGVTGERGQIRVRSHDGTDTLMVNSAVQSTTDLIMGLDTAGNILWHNSVKEVIYNPGSDENSYNIEILSADINDEGNIHVLYEITKRLNFVPAFPIVSGCKMYVLKFSPTGEYLQTTPLTMSGIGSSYYSLCWINHKYYITFRHNTTTNPFVVNGDTIYPGPWTESHLVCYKEDGVFEFYKLLGTTLKTYNMQRDEYGHLYHSCGGGDVSGVPLPGEFIRIPLVIKYDTLGNVLSYKYNESYGECTNIAQISDSTFAMVGNICDETDFDGVFSDEGCERPFVAVVNENSGRFLHAATAPASDGFFGDNVMNAVAADPDGNLIVGGYFRAQEIQVGDSLFTNQWSGYFDMFVARYGWACGEPAEWPSLGTGIAEHETPGETNSPLRPYPNPATDHFDIDASLLKEGTEVSLYDMSGRLVRTSFVIGGSAHFNISDLVPGFYLLKVGDAVGKVVKHP